MQPNEHPDFADIIDMELDCTEYDLKGATEEQPILPGVLDGTTV